MNLKIDNELRDLIPPLSQDEYRLLEEGNLGFESEDKLLKLTPSNIGAMWFHANYIDETDMTETYTKRPMAFSRLSQLMPYYDLLRNKKMNPIKMNPEPLDFNDSKVKKESNKKTNVYLIQSVIGGPVKIGKANNVEERLKQHQCGSPFLLELIKVYENVHCDFEKELHNKFDNYRVHGEWFNEEILKFISL